MGRKKNMKLLELSTKDEIEAATEHQSSKISFLLVSQLQTDSVAKKLPLTTTTRSNQPRYKTSAD